MRRGYFHKVAAADYLDNPERRFKLALFPNGCAVRKSRLEALENTGRPLRIACSAAALI